MQSMGSLLFMTGIEMRTLVINPLFIMVFSYERNEFIPWINFLIESEVGK